MHRPIWRRRFIVGAASTFASIGVLRGRARAAQWEYKAGHDLPASFPLHIRMVEMWDAVNRETGGRLHVTVFPNSQLGGQSAMLSQLRSGAIQFLNTLNGVYSEVVPVAGIDAVGFAFKSEKDAEKTLDGPLGAYIRNEFKSKGMYAFEKQWALGLRQLSSYSKPIRSASDFAGFKMRTPPSRIAVDLFTTLGASPTPISAAEIYTSLQTHIVDGLDFPIGAIELFKLYEVQRYVTLTNHMWSGYWLTANLDVWNGLPADVRAIVERNAAKAALAERADNTAQTAQLSAKLQQRGMKFSDADTASMRARLGPYYARWKQNFGSTAWSLLETSVGKLG
jgi:TRAP-type transport system periplasmic protein